MPRFEPSDEMIHQITVPISIEPESKSEDICPWSNDLFDELLYEVAAQFLMKNKKKI